MAYEARRDDDDEISKEQEKMRNDANNAQAVRTLTAVGKDVPEAHVQAVSRGLDIASKVTGGKSDEIIGKALTRANNIAPGGKIAQGMTNKAMESGAVDAATKGLDIYNKVKGGTGGGEGTKAPETPNQVKKPGEGGEQNSSLPSSDKENNTNPVSNDTLEKKESIETENTSSATDETNETKSDDKVSGKGLFSANVALIPILLVIITVFMLIIVVSMIIMMGSGLLGDYEDAFGISEVAGMETGGISDATSDPDQIDFYNRVNNISLEYQANGKTVDPLLVVSVFHALNASNARISYSDITNEKITEVAEAMFVNNVYSESQFRENLRTSIIPSYLPNVSSSKIDSIVDEVFDYIDRYNDLIGKSNKNSSNCSSVGTCSYDIKGFYFENLGNVNKSLNINNLYVRLMQCGDNYGGTYGIPLEGEELVPFEKYILGVAYAEIGPSAPEAAFKAQMIAARSYALSRPTGAGNSWRVLQEEGDKWVLQLAACTADQVYCDPDKGCSSTDGQWSQVYSGAGHGRTIHGPIDAASPLRQYAADVQGEVLINNQGYIVYTPYTSTESNQFTSLARSGLNYKQIMMQVYNQKFPQGGISDIYKASCGSCTANGSYASWKQFEGEWVNVTLGTSGRTISQIGCLATSVSIQIARSGVATNVSDFNPGTFVEYLNSHGGFASTGDFNWESASSIAPSFQYQGKIWLQGKSKQEKLNEIRNLVNQSGVYVVAEVMGDTGQHWVAIDSVNGDTINMMDPGSRATDMWSQYNWANTSQLAYYRVS